MHECARVVQHNDCLVKQCILDFLPKDWHKMPLLGKPMSKRVSPDWKYATYMYSYRHMIGSPSQDHVHSQVGLIDHTLMREPTDE